MIVVFNIDQSFFLDFLIQQAILCRNFQLLNGFDNPTRTFISPIQFCIKFLENSDNWGSWIRKNKCIA